MVMVVTKNYICIMLSSKYGYLHLTSLIFHYSHPGYFGKVGMRVFNMNRSKQYCPTINLDRIWSLVSEQTREHYKDKKDVAPVIDCGRAVS